MDLKNQIIKEKLPRHVAVIMDGNGRWAQKRGNARIFGHQNAVESVRQVVEAAGELQIEYLTLYAFSTENWQRPKSEVDALMSLMVRTIQAETENLNENNVKLNAIGEIDDLPRNVQVQLNNAVKYLSGNTGLNLTIGLSYSGRWDIADAAKRLARAVKKGEIDPEDIDSCVFESYLSTSAIPDPELLIRTSGERRISNFLLWQVAYTELYFTPVLWPDFRKEHFYEALIDFQRRDRRFGKVKGSAKIETVNN